MAVLWCCVVVLLGRVVVPVPHMGTLCISVRQFCLRTLAAAAAAALLIHMVLISCFLAFLP